MCTREEGKLRKKPTVLLAWRNRIQGDFSCWKMRGRLRKETIRDEVPQILCLNSARISGWLLNHACIKYSPNSQIEIEPPKRCSLQWESNQVSYLLIQPNKNQYSPKEHNRTQSLHNTTVIMSRISSKNHSKMWSKIWLILKKKSDQWRPIPSWLGSRN